MRGLFYSLILNRHHHAGQRDRSDRSGVKGRRVGRGGRRGGGWRSRGNQGRGWGRRPRRRGGCRRGRLGRVGGPDYIEMHPRLSAAARLAKDNNQQGDTATLELGRVKV